MLTELIVGDDPATWKDAGFNVDGDHSRIGSVIVRLVGTAAGRGIRGWHLAGLSEPDASGDPPTLDGLPTTHQADVEGVEADADDPSHPNGVRAIDHVVVASPDLGRTVATFESHGLEARRVRDVGTPDSPRQQVFFWIGQPILELVGPTTPSGDGPARFYGLALTSDDLDATAAYLGERVGRVKDAVQPGRRIATLRHRDLDISVPIAFMSAHSRATDSA